MTVLRGCAAARMVAQPINGDFCLKENSRDPTWYILNLFCNSVSVRDFKITCPENFSLVLTILKKWWHEAEQFLNDFLSKHVNIWYQISFLRIIFLSTILEYLDLYCSMSKSKLHSQRVLVEICKLKVMGILENHLSTTHYLLSCAALIMIGYDLRAALCTIASFVKICLKTRSYILNLVSTFFSNSKDFSFQGS